MAACDPGLAVQRLVRLDDDGLVIDGVRHELDPDGRIVVLGAGKASLKIALALERILGERLHGGAVVVRHGAAPVSLERIELLEAAHPLPDERSVAAAVWLLEQAAELGERDLVIACFTGGSSALSSLPPAGVSPAEKRDLHELLLVRAWGSPRSTRSASRSRRSRAAAWRWRVAPARLINLTRLRRRRRPLDAITDPSVADSSQAADAIAILHSHGLWARTPRSIREHLAARGAGRRTSTGRRSRRRSWSRARPRATRWRSRPRARPRTRWSSRPASRARRRRIGRLLANLADQSAAARRPFAPVGDARLRGREHRDPRSASRVRRGRTQPGGGDRRRRLELEGTAVAAVFLDTDGSDGGTDLAGAIVDGATVERARARHRPGDGARSSTGPMCAGGARRRHRRPGRPGPTSTTCSRS